MKPKTLMLLVVAAGCGLVAMFGIQQAMQGGQDSSPKVRVLVAKTEIAPGTELTDEAVGFVEMPADAVPEDAVTAVEQYANRSCLYPTAAQDIIRQSKLGKPGEFTRSRQIPLGMQATSIAVNDTQTMGNMLRPGDRVDVWVTYQIRDTRGTPLTKSTPLLKFVEVFATDNRTVSDGAQKQDEVKTKTVSLLVTNKQVGYLTLAQSKGTLNLSWRNPEDKVEGEGETVDEGLLAELSGLEKLEDGGIPVYDREPAKKDDENTNNLNALLDDQGTAEPVTVQPSRPTWDVQIYNGDVPTTTSFELQPGESPATGSPAANAGGEGPLEDAFRWLGDQFVGEKSQTTEKQATTTKL